MINLQQLLSTVSFKLSLVSCLFWTKMFQFFAIMFQSHLNTRWPTNVIPKLFQHFLTLQHSLNFNVICQTFFFKTLNKPYWTHKFAQVGPTFFSDTGEVFAITGIERAVYQCLKTHGSYCYRGTCCSEAIGCQCLMEYGGIIFFDCSVCVGWGRAEGWGWWYSACNHITFFCYWALSGRNLYIQAVSESFISDIISCLDSVLSI